MEINKENKDEIRERINRDINTILEKHELPYRMDGISVMKHLRELAF